MFRRRSVNQDVSLSKQTAMGTWSRDREQAVKAA